MYSHDFGYSLPSMPGGGSPVPQQSGFDVFGVEIDISSARRWWELSQEAVDVWKGAYAEGGGGSSPWGSAYANQPYDVCPGTPDFDAVLRWAAEAPDQDIQRVIGYLLDSNRGNGPKSRAELADPQYLPNWVKALMGGKDCKASTFPEAPGMLQASVRKYGGPGIQQSIIEGVPFAETLLMADTGQVAMWAGAALAALFLLKKLS